MRRWVLLGACWLLIACQPRQTGSENGVWVPNLRVVGRTQDYETVRYERDGVPLYAEIYRPKGKSRAPAVVLLPGGFVGVNANHRAAARRLAQAGYLVALPHMRGQGKSGGFIDFGLEDAVDVRGLAKSLPQVGGDGRYAYIGISLGGAIAINAARNDSAARGVVCIMTPIDFREQRQLLLHYERTERAQRWDDLDWRLARRVPRMLGRARPAQACAGGARADYVHSGGRGCADPCVAGVSLARGAAGDGAHGIYRRAHRRRQAVARHTQGTPTVRPSVHRLGRPARGSSGLFPQLAPPHEQRRMGCRTEGVGALVRGGRAWLAQRTTTRGRPPPRR
jgi:pimeloyl-ACP methyl ester carboxylesterase